MPRQQFNDGMEVDFEDQNAAQKNIERELYEKILYRLCNLTDGFFQDSFKVDFTDATHVTIRAGLGIQLDNSQVAPDSIRRQFYLPSNVAKAITTPDPTNPRIDLIVVKADRATTTSAIRQFKDFVTSAISPVTFVVETDWLSTTLVVAGTPAPSPVAPAVPSGYLAVASVAVAAVTGIAGSGSITDMRTLMPINDLAKIDTSLFVSVPTKAVGTPLKQVLSELDGLGVSAAQVGIMYDAIVGSAVGCNYASLNAALAAAVAGWRILVTENQTVNSTLNVAVADVEIHVKPKVSIVKGSAATGIQFQASGGSIHGGKMSGFSAGGNKALQFLVGAPNGRVWDMRFSSNDTDIDDSATTVLAWGNYSS